ncbi:MAG: glutaconyl-CoA decarboxylase subunit alpha [Syntrophus sp. (in: bacteria)]|nr:glutaconyl-CoA decarboxylase subunit alpha [Syntrophus sp. (in: bacteria)]
MRPYFEKMQEWVKPAKVNAANAEEIKKVEQEIAELVEKAKNAGMSAEALHKRGEWTVHERLAYIVEPGTWCPLHTLYDPLHEESGTTGVVDGLGKINGRWCVIIGFDNKVMAGAWIAGQPHNILRVTDMAKRLHCPLVWLVNCSGVKLPEQEKMYADRRGSGTTFFRHAELNKLGIPVLAAIYGTNPAGGGYQGISPTLLLAHKDCNIAVGGAGIVSGMSPKGFFDEETAEQLIDATRKFKSIPPGRVEIHYDHTGFFKQVFQTEESILDAVKEWVTYLPAYNSGKFFRVAEPAEPKFPAEDLYSIMQFNQKMTYDVEMFMARLTDNSEHMEFRPGYGPELYTGLIKVDGFLMAIVGNRQGMMPKGYPEYAPYPGIGGKFYRQGLIKVNEFVSLCGRDRIPMIWLQDTSGIDVGDIAEKAELLGLGQALIYSIEQSDLPMMTIILRKGTAAAHYIMAGPQANNNNVFTLGTATTEIYVMHGETAAAASFARRLVKEKDAGKPLAPVIAQMNKLVKAYYDNSRPSYCAKAGLVDEVVAMKDLRKYFVAFANCCYQNPSSITPQHQMILARIIKG